MKKPDIPEDEHRRLKDLRSLGILDTPSEERFDRLTRMARRMFDVPIALVSLVDENRQWFKSCMGLDVRETPRDISFCGHAILGDDVFIIPDAMEDDRFKDNPLVLQAPFIRFYAGCPLKLPSSRKMGTLCIIDVKPRQMNDEDVALLKDLAAMVENEIAALQIATIDELTRVSNRRGFLELAQKALDYCRRYAVPASLVFFDLDNFKLINDNFGHVEGDKALTLFADLMSKNIRDSDIVARIGGDEFVALLLNSSRESAQIAVSNFQDALNHYNQKTDSGCEIGFSHGVVAFDPSRHDAIEDLLKEGDALMYECKRRLKSAHKKSK